MSEPIFYIVELELPDADLESFLRWYAAVHTPHLYEAGFTLCTSYRAISGAMSLVDIYQAPGWEIFESAPFQNYRRVAAADPHRPPYIGVNKNTRTPYHHVQWKEPADKNIDIPLVADWITVWRFAGAQDVFEKAQGWLRREGEAHLHKRGVQHVRLLRKGREAPTGSSIRPEGAIVLQWKTQPSPEACGRPDLPDWALGSHDHFTGYRLYPWADDPAVRANFWTGRT